jgi:F-type H+-transporting ATPase subunit c
MPAVWGLRPMAVGSARGEPVVKQHTALAPWKEDLMGMEFLAAGLPLATLTLLGKSIGFGLAVGLAAFGTAIGVGLIFASMLQTTGRQPELKQELTPIMWIGFALTEAVVFYGLVGAMMMVFLI